MVDGGCPWWLGSNVVASPADKNQQGGIGLGSDHSPKTAATGAVEVVVLTPLECVSPPFSETESGVLPPAA